MQRNYLKGTIGNDIIPIVYQNELKAILPITIACPELVSGVNADNIIKAAFETK